jgi:hypothetical protein
MVGPNLVKKSETLFEVTIFHLNNIPTFCDKASPVCLVHSESASRVGLRHTDIKAQRRQMFDGIAKASVDQNNITLF